MLLKKLETKLCKEFLGKTCLKSVTQFAIRTMLQK